MRKKIFSASHPVEAIRRGAGVNKMVAGKYVFVLLSFFLLFFLFLACSNHQWHGHRHHDRCVRPLKGYYSGVSHHLTLTCQSRGTVKLTARTFCNHLIYGCCAYLIVWVIGWSVLRRDVAADSSSSWLGALSFTPSRD